MNDGMNGGRVAATFGARPKILIEINDMDDAAEKAIAWLKAHGVETN